MKGSPSHATLGLLFSSVQIIACLIVVLHQVLIMEYVIDRLDASLKRARYLLVMFPEVRGCGLRVVSNLAHSPHRVACTPPTSALQQVRLVSRGRSSCGWLASQVATARLSRAPSPTPHALLDSQIGIAYTVLHRLHWPGHCALVPSRWYAFACVCTGRRQASARDSGPYADHYVLAPHKLGSDTGHSFNTAPSAQ